MGNNLEALTWAYNAEIADNTDALANIFADLAYWGSFSDSTLGCAQILHHNKVPFGSELVRTISEIVDKPADANQPTNLEDMAAEQQVFTAGLKAMGYGNLQIEPKLLEAAAGRIGWGMEPVRLTLVPSPWDLIAIARELGRTMPYAERSELSSNTRRALIRCGGDRYFNNLMIRLYKPRLLALTMVEGLAYDLHLAAGN